ncbi:uncharacterized protein BKA55DRAFT_695740 [Fusarium redolens]|uniref:Uncharacterized protein n=1 Tax=Fusarium redolens TaxID=48865 RepID=A0A9P9G4F8_FUSRE|nr:uncharacterized protein BKA55DRAFT_695740 [Fusarium redolens]KAH7232321.1 hypothetical protein BKA55DRAFT_695740 [Fusarium redolens]
MGAAPENRDSGVWAKLRADIIRTPTRSGVEARLGVSLWGPNVTYLITKPTWSRKVVEARIDSAIPTRKLSLNSL